MDCEDLFSLARDGSDFRPPNKDRAHAAYCARMERYEREYAGYQYDFTATHTSLTCYRFCRKAGISVNLEEIFEPPPTLNVVVAFLQYQARTKRGTNDPKTGKIVVSMLEKMWRELCLQIRNQTGYEYSRKEKHDVTQVSYFSVCRDDAAGIPRS
jgi:hypothetical protein